MCPKHDPETHHLVEQLDVELEELVETAQEPTEFEGNAGIDSTIDPDSLTDPEDEIEAEVEPEP